MGGGAFVHGGTDWARSTDGGETWSLEGTILAPTTDPRTTAALKLSLAAGGQTVFAYGARSYPTAGEGFGHIRNEPVLCRSTDGGRTWSVPRSSRCRPTVPWRFPMARCRSHRAGSSRQRPRCPPKTGSASRCWWRSPTTAGIPGRAMPSVFADPQRRYGYFEQKLAELAPGHLIATAWTVTLGDVADQPDSFALSHDNGLTWGPARSTGISGQTMTAIPLGGDRLLVLYNRRYGDQAIIMNLVTFTETEWAIHFEGVLYDARAQRERPEDIETGVEELGAFAFGFPTAIRLQDGTYLATHWCQEDDRCGIRWTKLRLAW